MVYPDIMPKTFFKLTDRKNWTGEETSTPYAQHLIVPSVEPNTAENAADQGVQKCFFRMD